MKRLRRTIRQILLENTEHFDKLAKMLCTGNLENVNQALDLAETLDYIHNVEYDTSPLSTRSDMRINKTVHRWSFSAVKEFEEMILDEWDNTSVHNLRYGVFVIYPTRNHSIGIKLIATIED